MIARTDVISAMYTDTDITDAIGKMHPEELRDDLRQEIFLVLCELEEERLMTMHREGWLKFFVVRTMLNMIKSDRSTFYNKFRKGFDELTDISDKYEAEQGADASLYVNASMEKLHWYEREIMRIYADNGQNIALLSRDTNIPYRSLFKTIRKVKYNLKRDIRNHDEGQEPTRIRMRLMIEIELEPAADTDTIMECIDTIDDSCRTGIAAITKLNKYSGFKIGRID